MILVWLLGLALLGVAAFVFAFGVRAQRWLMPSLEWPDRTWQVWRLTLTIGLVVCGLAMLAAAVLSA